MCTEAKMMNQYQTRVKIWIYKLREGNLMLKVRVRIQCIRHNQVFNKVQVGISKAFHKKGWVKP